MLRLLALASFGVALAVAAVPACVTHACTDVGCRDGFNVQLEAQSWPSGTYVFDVAGDAKTLHCEGKLPLPPCGTDGLTCTGDLDAFVTYGGCSLPADQQSFAAIEIHELPAHVTVAITRDGSSIASATYTPTYEVFQPNGAECGPTCHGAGAKLTVSP